MRVLEVNKFMHGGGGAETVMFATADLLSDHGHDVAFVSTADARNHERPEPVWYAPHRSYESGQPAWDRARSAASAIYSRSSRRTMATALDEWLPDVVHVHNIYHQLTLSILDECALRGVPVVMTVHDYKPVCPSYVLYTDGQVCHRCVGRAVPLDVVRHRCIKGSLGGSAVALTEALVVRAKSQYDKVSQFIAPSQHMADMLIQGGFPASKISMIRNFVGEGQFALAPAEQRNEDVLYIGRLEAVKGLGVLLSSAKHLPAGTGKVIVAGRGSLAATVEVAASDGLIDFRGLLDWVSVRDLLDRVAAIVVPSLWEENSPMVVLEAGARGCPVIVSDSGGLTELVEDRVDGLLVPHGDAAALADAITRLRADGELRSRLSHARHLRTRSEHGPRNHYQQLIGVFRDAIEAVRTGSGEERD